MLNFIERGGRNFHKAVSARLKRGQSAGGRSRKGRRIQDERKILEGKIHEFLKGQPCELKWAKPPNVHAIAQALATIRSQLKISPAQYQNLVWEAEGADMTGRSPVAPDAMSREHRVMQRHIQIERKSDAVEGIRRLSLLWVVYEVSRLQLEAERQDAGRRSVESDVAAAERVFSERSGADAKYIRHLRNSCRRYLDIATYTNGLGMILLLGSQTTIL